MVDEVPGMNVGLPTSAADSTALNRNGEPRLVSTVITSYNKGPYLGEAIESALRQDYAPQEIIVVDDGSTDNTRAVAEAFGQHILYCVQSNQGPAAAKNRGILLGRGEYVAFLDGDDRWRPDKLRRQVELLENNLRAGVVYGPAAAISACAEAAPTAWSRIAELHRGQILDELLVRNFVPFSSTLVRRRLFAVAGMLDETQWVADDYELWLRFARHCDFDFVDDILVDYRVGVDQISSRVSSGRNYGCALQIQRTFVDRFYGGKYPRPDVFRRGIAAKYAELGDCLLGSGRHGRAIVAHALAACQEPGNVSRWKSVLRDLIPNALASRARAVLCKSAGRRGESTANAVAAAGCKFPL